MSVCLSVSLSRSRSRSEIELAEDGALGVILMPKYTSNATFHLLSATANPYYTKLSGSFLYRIYLIDSLGSVTNSVSPVKSRVISARSFK